MSGAWPPHGAPSPNRSPRPPPSGAGGGKTPRRRPPSRAWAAGLPGPGGGRGRRGGWEGVMRGSQRRGGRTDRRRSAGARGGGGCDARKQLFGRPAPVGAGGRQRGGAETAAVWVFPQPGCPASEAGFPRTLSSLGRSPRLSESVFSSAEWGR